MQRHYPEAQHFILDERSVESHPFLRIISFPWLSQTISPRAGVSREIFRSNGTYTFSVRPDFKGEYPKVYRGDYIYSISLLPHAYSFAGVIVTKDSKRQGYDMHIELSVINPTRFIETYHNGHDPARSVFTQFKQTFEYYTSKMEDTTEAKAGLWLDRQVAVLSQAWGIQVMHPVWFFHAFNEDTKGTVSKEDIEQAARRKKREFEIEYELKAYEDRLKRGLEREQKDFIREERARNNDFARSEMKKKKVLEEQIRLLSSTVSGLIQMNNDRVNDSIGYNLPESVLKDSLKLLASLNNSLDHSSQEAEAIIDTILSNETLLVDNEEDYAPDTTMHPTASSTADTDGDVDRRRVVTNSEISLSLDA